jgi:hypothetical protein
MPLPPWDGFPTLGWQVIDWLESYLCHGPGDVQGDDLEIDDEIALFILWAYRLHPQGHAEAGRRLVHRAVLSRAKGRAKSEIAGALDCAEALGPVRCDGFDAAGEPVGVRVRYPFVRIMATEEDQAGNTYDNVTYMLTEGEAANEYAIDLGRTAETSTRIYIKEQGGGEIVPSSSGDASKDGGKESKATADETHLYILKKHRGMYRTVARNTGKRKAAEPWMLDTTTAWQPGERSVAEQAGQKYAHLPVEEAVLKHGVLYDHRQGPEPKRFGDDRSLIKAMREAYGPAAEWMDFKRIVNIVRDAEDPEDEAYRYYLNRPRAAASHWLSPDEIAEVLTEDTPAPGAKVGLGFDGSENDDHTALWICTRDGLLQPVGIWTPAGESIAWRSEVDEAVEWVFSNFDVVNFKFDPPYWMEEGARWAGEHPGKVEELWTGGRTITKFAVACGALRSGIRQEQATINPTPLLTEPQTMGGKPLAVAHFENARTHKVRVKVDEEHTQDAYTVRKDRKGSPLKIDSVPAAVLARRARDDAEKKGLFDEPEYDSAQW